MSIATSVKHKLLTDNPYDGIGTFLYSRVGPPALQQHYQIHTRALATQLPSNARVLDVGSGPADMILQLARRRQDLELVGLDPAASAIDTGNKKAQKQRCTNVEFIQSGADSIPRPDDYFDVITSIGSYKHWPSRENGLSEIKRVLKPGGEFYIFELDATAGRKNIPSRYKLPALVAMPIIKRFIKVGSISKDITREEVLLAGFEILQETRVDYMPLYQFVLTKS
ncbi:MAG: methyltransferase domain-containing protein [Pseudomonadales bacterium]|nr:methyltransferase domain-containing protein [Pseudomonadales bacterium]